MSQVYWTELVRRLSPYVPGEQRFGQNIVKLNTNENPYPPAPGVLQALSSITGDALRRYPDPESLELRQALAEYHQLKLAQVFVGNGSDEILALAFMAFFTGSKSLQFPTLSYSFYPVYCDLLNIEQNSIALQDDFSINLDAFTDNGGGIVFPNPNAPTSMAVTYEQIESLLARVPNTVVLVDEAYADFGARSVSSLVNKYPNLLVSQTFSKGRSMAGMRLGVAMGSPDLIDALTRVKNSFNSYPIDAAAQKAGIASLQDDNYYKETIEKICVTRAQVVAALQERNFKILPSAANFIFVSPPQRNAARLFDWLNQHDILVRYWNKGDLTPWLRITIGTDAEMQQLISCIDGADFL
jgi:histidinol-phosphate aminotransferase